MDVQPEPRPSGPAPAALDGEQIRRLLNAYAFSTGLGAVYLSADAATVYTPDQYAALCPFCHAVQSCPEGKRRCMEHIHRAGQLSLGLGQGYITRCHAGLIELFAPVVANDRYVGCVACGPLLMWELDDSALEEIAANIRPLQLDTASLLHHCAAIRIYSGKSVQASADLLFMAVNQLARADLGVLEHRRQMTCQQQRISELVAQKKQAMQRIDSLQSRATGRAYPIHKERELLSRVRLGDRNGAREILNEILGEIFLYNAGNLEIIKARVIEMVAMLSRAAAEGGASLDNLLGMNCQALWALVGISAFDELCIAIKNLLETMIDQMNITRSPPLTQTLQHALQFIRDNYARPLTLDEVARSVFVSPYHLSHTLKNELNITFVEYLTGVRIEAARTLLATTGRNVGAIANAVGYEDAGYFSKVFKKNTGMTPVKYRMSAR